MPLAHHPIERVVNIHWGGGVGFLYSGADGMFGSKDGVAWAAAPSSVPATSLAWVDDVWLAAGSGTLWRSEDGAKTWQATSGPDFEQIAACKPSTVETDEDGEEIPNGIFAGYRRDDEGEHEEVYISTDLGLSWSKALDVPTEFGADGYESATVLSGCGNGIFLSTIKGDTRLSSGDGCVYAAMDGGGFGGRQQVWSGSNKIVFDPDPTYLAYSAGAVGFDSTSQSFCLMYYKEEGFGPGGAEGSEIAFTVGYGTGSGGSFGGENALLSYTKAPLADSFSQVRGGLAAAGGDGQFAGTYRDEFSSGTTVTGGLVVTFFGGSATTMISVDDNAQAGPVCWKPGKETEEGTEAGIFACAAFAGGQGGVWIAQGGGSWTQTHGGEGFASAPRGGLAVGKLSWLGRSEA